MKKLSLLAFAGALFFVSSCEDDDTPEYVSPNYLAGEWNLMQKGSLSAGNIVDYVAVAGTCDESDDIVFNEDYTFSSNDAAPSGETCETVSSSGTYALNGRDVQLTSGEVTSTLTVITLTFEVMEVSYTDAETNELVFLKFSKQ